MKKKLITLFLLVITNVSSLATVGCNSNQFQAFTLFDESREESNKNIAFDFMYNQLPKAQQPKLDSSSFLVWKWALLENRNLLRARTHGFVKLPRFPGEEQYWTLYFRKTKNAGIFVNKYHESDYNPGW